MKSVKKLLVALITLVVMIGMGVSAFAENADHDSGKGGEGSLTIKNANIDQTYELYRIFEAIPNEDDPTKVSYKPLAGKTIPENDYFKVENGYIVVQDAAKDSADATALSAVAIEWLTANYVMIGEKVTEVTPSETGDQKVTGLLYGYYYVTTTTGTAVSVDTTNMDAEVEDKNPGTTIDKTITDVVDGSVSADNDNALAQIGTTISYEVRIHIADNAKTYKFTDVMTDGLTYVNNSMKVYLVEEDAAVADDETPLGAGTDSAAEYGTLTETSGATGDNPDVTIVFNDAMLAENNGKDIVLHYEAVLNGNAVIAGENPNTATIHWGHETDALKATDDAKVYTAQIIVKKIDGDNKALEGAGFKLKNHDNKWYHLKDDGTVEWVTDEASATEINPMQAEIPNPDYSAEDAAAAGEDYDIPETIKSSDAAAAFTGLSDGTYTLVETTVPDGYNKAVDQEVTIKAANTNNLISELSVESEVTNQQGTELPSTGGMGTTIFYTVGGILVLCAGILLVSRRRMTE